MTVVTVYTTPACPQCMGTKRWLDTRSIVYEEVDLSRDEQALEAVREMGHETAPVVFVSPASGVDIHWSGMRPDKLAQHATTQEEAA